MRNKKGVTLVELLIVIIIIAILVWAVYMISSNVLHEERYVKAFSLLRVVSEAKREQMVRNPEVIVLWQIKNSHNNTNPNTCRNYDVETKRGAGYLIACGFLQPENWDSEYYKIYLCHQGQGGGCCGSGPAGTIACTIFYPDPDEPGTRWNYYITQTGDCTNSPGAIPCLEF